MDATDGIGANLLALPQEVLAIIFDYIVMSKDLAAVALVCRELCSAVEPYLYSNIIDVPSQKALESLFMAFENEPSRLLHVRSFTYGYINVEFEPVSSEGALISKLTEMSKLVELSVKNPGWPETAFVKWDDAQRARLSMFGSIFKAASLQDSKCLQGLRICVLDVGFTRTLWDLQSVEYILVHPTLKSLTLRYVKPGKFSQKERLWWDDRLHHSTSLESLTLESCGINLDHLSRIMNLPRNLRSLALRHTLYICKSDSLLELDVASALSPQRDYLVNLEINRNEIMHDRALLGLHFADWQALQSLTVDSSHRLSVPRSLKVLKLMINTNWNHGGAELNRLFVEDLIAACQRPWDSKMPKLERLIFESCKAQRLLPSELELFGKMAELDLAQNVTAVERGRPLVTILNVRPSE